MKLKKALTVANIVNQKIERLPFEGEFYEAFSQPQNRGVWFVWGGSGSGKSTFIMKLAKEIAKHESVHYNPLEEETDDAEFIERTELVQMVDVEDKFKAQTYPMEEFDAFLSKQRSAKVGIIDSGVYFFKNFEEYLQFKRKHRNKILIITGHAQGSQPRSELEKSIMYDAKMKIFVSGYLASCKGRTIGPNGGQFIIWKEGYEKVNGTNSE